MPYREKATLRLAGTSGGEFAATMWARVVPYRWDERSLHFHAAWRRDTGIPLHNIPDEWEKCADWNFAAIEGRDVYMGDVLSLYNHTPAWYGEGDEKIWVDDEPFPSHFGTGT